MEEARPNEYTRKLEEETKRRWADKKEKGETKRKEEANRRRTAIEKTNKRRRDDWKNRGKETKKLRKYEDNNSDEILWSSAAPAARPRPRSWWKTYDNRRGKYRRLCSHADKTSFRFACSLRTAWITTMGLVTKEFLGNCSLVTPWIRSTRNFRVNCSQGDFLWWKITKVLSHQIAGSLAQTNNRKSISTKLRFLEHNKNNSPIYFSSLCSPTPTRGSPETKLAQHEGVQNTRIFFLRITAFYR